MTNSRTLKRALLTSIIALVVCFSMLVGTTFAWFTDSVTSSGNIIQSGTLEVAMSWADGKEDPNSVAWKDAKDGAIFNNDKWEPGYVEARHIKIENKGTLAFKYKLLITPNGAVEELADVIDVYFVEGATQVNRDSFAGVAPVGTLRDLINDVDGAAHGALLPVGQATTNTYERVGVVTSTIAFKMREEAGNEYQGKKIGADFAIQLLATQYTFENDSIDNGYDGDSTYPNVSVPVAVPADTTQSIALSANGMKMEVPAAALPTGTTTVSLVYTDPNVDTTTSTVTYDSIELVDQDGNIIDLEGNTEEMTITLPTQTTFTAGAIVYIYHDGEYVDLATVNADGTISYETTHLCEVVVYDKYLEEYFLPVGVTADDFGSNVAYFNGTYYATLKDALIAIHNSNSDSNVLYLKPNADLGTVTHAHVCSSIIVYGNGARATGGGADSDFEIGSPQATGMTCTIDSAINLTVYELHGCGVWGAVPKNANVSINLKNCKDVLKIVLPNYSTGNYDLSVSISNCTFTANDDYVDSAIWCRGLDSLTISETTFTGFAVGINQNNKDAVENYTLTNCTFVDCSTQAVVTTQTSYAAPVRVVASAAGSVTNLIMNGCKFVYTTADTAINGDILTYQDGNAGTVNVTIDGVAQ